MKKNIMIIILCFVVVYLSIAASQPLPSQNNIICFDATKPVNIYHSLEYKTHSYSFRVLNPSTQDKSAVLVVTVPDGTIKTKATGLYYCNAQFESHGDNLYKIFGGITGTGDGC